MKVTFKRNARPTGLAAVCHRDSWIIKHNKKVIGQIYQPEYGVFKVRLTVLKSEDELKSPQGTKCIWKWIELSKVNSSYDETQKWIQEIFTVLSQKYQIHYYLND